MNAFLAWCRDTGTPFLKGWGASLSAAPKEHAASALAAGLIAFMVAKIF